MHEGVIDEGVSEKKGNANLKLLWTKDVKGMSELGS